MPSENQTQANDDKARYGRCSMVYDPKKEGPRITIVAGHEVLELPSGGFKILTSEGPLTEELFATIELASDYVLTLEPDTSDIAAVPEMRDGPSASAVGSGQA